MVPVRTSFQGWSFIGHLFSLISVKDLLLEEILCCITYNIGKLRREYMKVKLQIFCEVMKAFRERSYENFYNPQSSDGGA